MITSHDFQPEKMSYFQLAILSTIFSVISAQSVCPMLNGGSSMRDPVAEQLTNFRNNKQQINTQTTDYGAPVGDNKNVMTVGPNGPMVLQDTAFIDELSHFNRERTPERIVHAKAAGAFGYFKVTNDITQYSRAKLFSQVGKVTPVAARLSTASGEHGSADTVRDLRGMAVKFYTEEGNWDLPCINTPMFFIRDPRYYPSLVHALKRNPVTHLKDADMFWDFPTMRPEDTFAYMYIFSDSGLPYSPRFMDAHAVNTFKLVNENNEAVYCKFHFLTNQGVKNLSDEEAMKLAGEMPDFNIRDLYDAISNGNYPSWTMYIQVMTFQQASNWYFNPFDAVKIWPENEFPMIEVGVVTLNKNPDNYFAEVEQLAFAPSRMVRGIEASPDRILQGRLFGYPDTQRYRLGVNNLEIPVNRPINISVHNYKRDGYFSTTESNNGRAPNYYPNSFCGPTDDPAYRQPGFYAAGDVARWNDDQDNFYQAGVFYRETLDEGGRTRLIQNIARNLGNAKEFLQKRAVETFSMVDSDFGRRLQAQLTKMKS